MIKPFLKLVDDKHQFSILDKFNLFVQLSTDDLQCAIYDQNTDKYIAFEIYSFQGMAELKDVSANLKEIFSSSDLFKNKFSSAIVSIVTNKSTLVPLAVFDNQQLDKYLCFAENENLAHEKIKFTLLKEQECVAVFAIPIEINEIISTHLPDATIIHFSSCLIDGLIKKYSQTNFQHQTYIDMHPNEFELTVLNGKNLKLYKTFEYETFDDFNAAYDKALQQLKLTPESVEPLFVSNIEVEDLIKQAVENQSSDKIFIHVQQSQFEIIILSGKTLKFYNSFVYKSPEDFIFYLLNVLKQTKQNPDTSILLLSGQLEGDSALYNLMKKYVRYLVFIDRPEEAERCKLLEHIPSHYYLNLFNQIMCE